MSETDTSDSGLPDVCPEYGCEELTDSDRTDARDELICVDCGLIVTTRTTCAFSPKEIFAGRDTQ